MCVLEENRHLCNKSPRGSRATPQLAHPFSLLAAAEEWTGRSERQIERVKGCSDAPYLTAVHCLRPESSFCSCYLFLSMQCTSHSSTVSDVFLIRASIKHLLHSRMLLVCGSVNVGLLSHLPSENGSAHLKVSACPQTLLSSIWSLNPLQKKNTATQFHPGCLGRALSFSPQCI